MLNSANTAGSQNQNTWCYLNIGSSRSLCRGSAQDRGLLRAMNCEDYFNKLYEEGWGIVQDCILKNCLVACETGNEAISLGIILTTIEQNEINIFNHCIFSYSGIFNI